MYVLLQILQRGLTRCISLENSSSSELDSSGSSMDSIWRAAASPPPKITRSPSCWHRFKWYLSALRTLGKGAVGVRCCRQNCDWYMFLKSDSGISFFKLFFSRNWINVWATLFSSVKDLPVARQGCLLPRRNIWNLQRELNESENFVIFSVLFIKSLLKYDSKNLRFLLSNQKIGRELRTVSVKKLSRQPRSGVHHWARSTSGSNKTCFGL